MPCRIHVWAFGLTCGLFAGFGLFFLTWWLLLLEGGQPAPLFVSRIYPGYSVTPVGSLIGLVWGFADWFVGGVIFGWFYNLLTRGRKEAHG